MKSIFLNIISCVAIFLSPIKELLLLLLIVVLFDTLFGIFRAYKKKEQIRSHKLFNFVVKIGCYFTGVICMFIIDLYIFGPIFGVTFFLAKSLSLLFSFVELKSIDETSVSLGNQSLWVIASELIKKIAGIKKDIKEI